METANDKPRIMMTINGGGVRRGVGAAWRKEVEACKDCTWWSVACGERTWQDKRRRAKEGLRWPVVWWTCRGDSRHGRGDGGAYGLARLGIG